MSNADPSPKNPFVSYTLSLFLTRLSAAMIAFLITVVPGLVLGDDDNLLGITIVSCIFSMLYMMIFVYWRSMKMGLRDYDLVRDKHLKENRLKGLWCGLAAEAPVAVLLIVTICLKNFPVYVDMSVALGLAEFHYCWLYMIFQTTWIYFAAALILPALSWLGYRNGFGQAERRKKERIQKGKTDKGRA